MDIFVPYESPLSARSFHDKCLSNIRMSALNEDLAHFCFHISKFVRKKDNYIRLSKKSKFSGLLTD